MNALNSRRIYEVDLNNENYFELTLQSDFIFVQAYKSGKCRFIIKEPFKDVSRTFEGTFYEIIHVKVSSIKELCAWYEHFSNLCFQFIISDR